MPERLWLAEVQNRRLIIGAGTYLCLVQPKDARHVVQQCFRPTEVLGYRLFWREGIKLRLITVSGDCCRDLWGTVRLHLAPRAEAVVGALLGGMPISIWNDEEAVPFRDNRGLPRVPISGIQDELARSVGRQFSAQPI